MPEWFIGVLGLAGLVSLGLLYHSWLEKGLRKRTIATHLSEREIQAIFQRTVATFGWTLQRTLLMSQSRPSSLAQFTGR